MAAIMATFLNAKIDKRDVFMIEGPQIRAARALLSWSQSKLAEAADLSLPTIKAIEARGTGRSSVATVESVRAALETGGVEFIAANGGGPGVRLVKNGA